MPYYGYARGDYSTHGYGQGDPGFLSSLWKGVKKIAAPAIGFALGGPLGAAAGARLGGIGTPPIMAPVAPAQPRYSSGINLGPLSARGTQFYPPVPTVPKMPLISSGLGGRAGIPLATAGCCPTGFHLDKATGTRCVRNRRMNVANPRALRRSMRRVQGFEKLARRTISFTRRVKMKK